MSDKLVVIRCPVCGEQLFRVMDGHYCPERYVEGEGRHFIKAEEVEVVSVDAPCVLSVDEVGLLRRLAAVDQLPDEPLSDDESEAREVIDRLSGWASKEEG